MGKIIKLLSSNLEYFKGIKSFGMKPDGKSVTIRGDNGTGKTTQMDSFLWLLFGKDSQNKSDTNFAIKTIDTKTGEVIPDIEHTVSMDIAIQNGTGAPEKLSLKRTLKEKWVNKRGQLKKTFSGNETLYEINDVPKTKKEYDNKIADIIDEEIFRLITDPYYFNSLPWAKRREILIDICGASTDIDDIIKHSKDTGFDISGIAKILQDRDLAEHKKAVTASKKKISDEIKELPARIDELSKSMADISGQDTEAIEKKIKDIEETIAVLVENTDNANKRKEIAGLDADLAEENNKLKIAMDKKILDANKELKAIKESIGDIDGLINNKNNAVEKHKSSISAGESELERMRSEWKKINNETYIKNMQANQCPKCGYDLNEDARKKAEEDFNLSKSERLQRNSERGKTIAIEKKQAEDALKKSRTELADAIHVKNTLIDDLERKKLDIEKLESEVSAEEKVIMDRIADIQAKKEKLEADLKEYQKPDTSVYDAQLKLERNKLAEIETSKKTKARIEELKEREKKLSKEYEQLEMELAMCERHTVIEAELIQEQINSKFEIARFKLFEEQINGGIKDTCITLYDNVPYGQGLNTGAEINVGIDIIRTLSNHYGIKAPLFIDHSESVTDIIDIGTQMIKLAVDENCKTLEVK